MAIHCLQKKLVLLGMLTLIASACANQNDYPLFRWRLDSAIQSGKAVDRMFLSTAVDFRRHVAGGSQFGGKEWRFVNSSTGCEFAYFTDFEGRGVKYSFLSAE